MTENETKTCPYCGETILAIAKKCRYCGEWFDAPLPEPKKTKECPVCGEEIDADATVCPVCHENITEQKVESVKLHYVTHEPNFWQKLFQVYWVNPKSWLLKELTVDDGNITISVLNGNSLSAPIEECSFKFQIDKYDRMEIYVKHENRKIHFKEIPFMLEDEQWDDIRAFILDSCNAKITTLGKMTNAMMKIKEILECVVLK